MKKLLFLAFAISTARAEAQDWTGWHPGAYPTEEYYQLPVTNVTLTAVENAVVLTNWTSCSNMVVWTNRFLSDLKPDQSAVPITNRWTYALTRYDTNCQPEPHPWTAEVVATPASTTLVLYVRDLWALDDYRAREERWLAVAASNTTTSLVKPRFYRWNRDALVESKAWWLNAATNHFLDPSALEGGTLDAWFAQPQAWSWANSGAGATGWVWTVTDTPPKLTKARLCALAGLPFDLEATVRTGNVPGWVVGQLAMRTVTNAVYAETNCVRSWFDVTPYQYLNCGGSAGFPATVVETQTVTVIQDAFDCFFNCGTFDCEGCITTQTVTLCGAPVTVVLDGTNAQTVTAVCTSRNYAAGSTSIDYGWCGLRPMVTNVVATVIPAVRVQPFNADTESHLCVAGGSGYDGAYESYQALYSYCITNTATPYSLIHYSLARRVAIGFTNVLWELRQQWGQAWFRVPNLSAVAPRTVSYYGRDARYSIVPNLPAGAVITMHRVAWADLAAGVSSNQQAGPLVLDALPWPDQPTGSVPDEKAGQGREVIKGPAVIRWEFHYQ